MATATFGDKGQYTYNVDKKGTPYGAPLFVATPTYNPSTASVGASGRFADMTPDQMAYADSVYSKTMSAGVPLSGASEFQASGFSDLSSSYFAPTAGSYFPSAQGGQLSSIINTNALNAKNQKLDLSKTDPNDYLKDYSMDIPGQIETPLEKQEKEKDNILTEMMKSMSDVPDLGAIDKRLRDDLQIQQKQQAVADLTGQLNAIVSRGQAQQLAQVGQGRGIPEAIIGGIQAQIGRETAIAALPVQAQLQAAQGNLEMANDTLDRLFKIYSDDATNRYNARNKMFEVVYNIADKKEQRLIEEERIKNDRAYQETQDLIKTKNDIAIEAAKNGATAGKISNIANAKDFADAISAAGSSLQAPSTDVIKLDNGATLLIDKKTGRIIKNFGGGSNETNIPSSFSALVNTVASLETTVTGKQAVAGQMSNYIKNQDWNGAYNQIANTVAQGLPGETKTRFENARIDKEVLTGFREAIIKYQDAGGDMGLLKGSAEKITRKLGSVKDPALASIAVQLEREFQTYRNVMTGAAFTPAESREYEAVNPTSKKNIDLNLAVIDGALAQLDNRVNGTIRAKVPQAGDILKLTSVKINNEQAKTQVNQMYGSGSELLKSTFKTLLNSGYSDLEVLEYAKLKGLK